MAARAPRYARRGSLLVATVLGMTILLLVVATMVISGGREAELTQLRFQEARAGYAADAGANMALREIKRNSDVDGDGAIGTISNDSNANTDPTVGVGGARVRVTPTGSNVYTVTSRTGTPSRSYTLTATPSGAAHSDGFEGYTTGQSLQNVGGWWGWDNDSNAAGTVEGGAARTGVKSQRIDSTTDSVRLYTQTSGQWVYTAWQFIPTNVTGSETYFILLNTYSAGGAKSWSTQIRFQFNNNTVYDNMQGGVTGSTRTLVRNQWVPITVLINLDAGTQTVSYNNQVLFTGSWNRQGGARRLQAVDLYGSSSKGVLYDDISLTAVGGGGGGSTVTMVETP
ncbi:MAG: hypothetical protein Q8L55_14600 [Phycisphaerales bacterium]|nr:hypothetical protein [Phycisphaerales bacterium]